MRYYKRRYIYDERDMLIEEQVFYSDGALNITEYIHNSVGKFQFQRSIQRYTRNQHSCNLYVKRSGNEEITYNYDDDDRLIEKAPLSPEGEVGDISYIYDNNGNMISSSDGKSYEYDYENKMIGFDSAQATVRYEYDGLGHRISVEIDGVEKVFLVDANRKYAQGFFYVCRK